MSWQSGSCRPSAGGAESSFVSTDAYPAAVRIDGEDVISDERERVVLDESVGFTHVERGLYE